MSGRTVVAAACIALSSFAITLGAASASVSQPQAAATLMVTYIGTASLQVRLSDGTTVRSGTVVPAGSYMVTVDDPDFTTPKFTMNGPGVNISSDLDSTGMGIDRPATFGPYTLQTTSTYTIQDANLGAAAISFTTTATATATGGSSGGSSSTSGGSSSTGGSSSGGTTSGSTTTKLLGTLKASVSTAGKPTMTFGGTTVKTLKSGRYTIAIADHSTKAGFIVWKLGSHAMTLSTVAASKSSSQTLTLIPGKWFFEATTRGPRSYFTVT
jgi:hypothetical protein